MNEESKYYLDDKTRELRSIILGSLLQDIERIRDTIDDREKLTEVLSEVIAASLVRANKLSKESSEALIDSVVPVIETAIQTSSNQSPQPLSDGLAPVIGPAISKAIRDAFRQMNENVNRAASATLSPKAIGWRLKALFSKESFADIVMRHTIEYQVKHVFLIHAKTGLLLDQLSDGKSEFENADMVSSMLTAIQDFVSDSFQSGEGQMLESVEVGNLTLWIEKGSELIVAAAIYGQAPATYREVLKNTRLRISRQYSYELKNFQGDTAGFSEVGVYLKPCLVSKSKEGTKKRKSWLRYVLLLLLIAGGIYLLYSSYEKHARWSKALMEIENRNLALIIDEQQNWNSWKVKGILTGRELTIFNIYKKYGINPKMVESHWADISQYAFDVKVKNHLKERYGLPDITQARISGDTLHIRSVFSEQVKNKIDRDSVLRKDFGFTQITMSEIQVSSDADKVNQLIGEIESERIYFERGKVSLNQTEEIKLRAIAEKLIALNSMASNRGEGFEFFVLGYADSSGTSEKINLRISNLRAEQVYTFLVEKGVASEIISYKGMGNYAEATGKAIDQSEQRVVMIKIEKSTKP